MKKYRAMDVRLHAFPSYALFQTALPLIPDEKQVSGHKSGLYTAEKRQIIAPVRN
jgi:hypothetical protein